jgi:signal transduction histidine kinase
VSTVRRVAYGAATAIVCIDALAAVLGGWADSGDWSWLAVLGPLAIVLAWRLPSYRAELLAVAAGLAALWSVVHVEVGIAALALVFLAVATDVRSVPWPGWAGGLAGSFVSALVVANVFYGGPALLPWVVTVVGGGLGLLLRLWESTRVLTGETTELRGQAAWLEQRTAVARELHDVVGHQVTAMVVQAEAGQVGDPQLALRRIGDLGRTALSELDRLVVHLRDPQRDLTVTAPPRLLDIDELLAEPLRGAGVQVDVRIDDELGLDEAGVLAVYRIAQEALTNVARHAQARRAWVELFRSGDRVRLRVSDDGVGLGGTPRAGSGLVGIGERVLAHQGTSELVGRPGGGAMLDVSIPVGAA